MTFKSKFHNKKAVTVRAIMSLLADGAEHEIDDLPASSHYDEESLRRMLNEGVTLGAIRKVVNRQGRQTRMIKATEFGLDWWVHDQATGKPTNQKQWWEEEIVYPDYYDLYDDPRGPETLLNAQEIAECERIKTIIARRDKEEDKRLKAIADLPPEARLAIKQELDGTISASDQRNLDVHRKEGTFKLPPKPAHARTYVWVEFEGQTMLMDVEDIDDSVTVMPEVE